ncbi:MAG: VCBS repeat-containing protein, partial [Myxococcota bacterium]
NRPWLGVLALSSLLACASDIAVTDPTALSCSTDADCPLDLRCIAATSRCGTTGNLPPTIRIGVIDRSLDTVQIPIVVSDPDLDALTLTVTLADGTPVEVSPSGPLTTTSEPVMVDLTWDALAALGSGQFRAGLALDVSVRDPSGASDTTRSEPFDFGNDAPTLSSFSVDDSPVSALTVLRFAVADSSDDPISVAELTVVEPDGTRTPVPLTDGVDAAFPSGALSELASDATTPIDHSLTWDSRVLGGRSFDGAVLELRVSDGNAMSEPLHSGTFDIINNLAPNVLSVDIATGISGVSGPVRVEYVVADAESDPVDVRVEVSFDGGISYTPCDPFVMPTHEGLYDLATSPLGIRHTFVWDPTLFESRAAPSAAIRVRTSDGLVHPLPGTDASAGVVVPFEEQDDLASVGVVEQLTADGGFAPVLIAADINGDGFADAIQQRRDGGDGVEIYLNQGGPDHFDARTRYDPASLFFFALRGVGDADGDSIVDLVLTDANAGLLEAHVGGGTSSWNGTFSLAQSIDVESNCGVVTCDGRIGAAVSGQFDSDGDLDVVMIFGESGSFALLEWLTNGAISVWSRQGRIELDEDPRNLLVADLNGDTLDDLVVQNEDSFDLFLNQSGSLTFDMSIEVGGSIITAAVGDLNQDGLSDIAATLETSVELFLIDGASVTSESVATPSFI